MKYDCIIIGSGPAGLSAALNLKLHNKEFLWFGQKDMSRKVRISEKIANYPGVPMVTGEELNGIFLKQAEEMGIEINDQIVTQVSFTGKGFMALAGNDIFESKAMILATGAANAKGFPGEDELLGRGVSYCATCDGFLYKGKTVAAFIGDKNYEHEVNYLAGLASRVYYFKGFKDEASEMPENVELQDRPIKEIKGGLKVGSLIRTDGTEIPVDGVFILRNSVAPANLLHGLELDGPHIKVDRQCRTNIKGCFACGDCTGRPYQITKAVGEGNVAAHEVLDYLAELDKE